jgi:hypothetical protein
VLQLKAKFIPSRGLLTLRVELDLCSESESGSRSPVDGEEGKGDEETSMYSTTSLSLMMIDNSSRISRSIGKSLGFPTKTVLWLRALSSRRVTKSYSRGGNIALRVSE